MVGPSKGESTFAQKAGERGFKFLLVFRIGMTDGDGAGEAAPKPQGRYD